VTIRSGFALLAVLWLLTGAAVSAMTIALAARERIRATINRSAMMRSSWQAHDCLARGVAGIDELLARSGGTPADSLATLFDGLAGLRDCPGDVRFYPVGLSLDLGTVTSEMVRRAIGLQSIPAPVRDSLVDALLDWRDTDDLQRARGCERACYLALHRPFPRNAPLADVAELRLVRGFEKWDSLVASGGRVRPIESLFTVERGRIAIPWAPFDILATLPGIGVPGARDIVAHRSEHAGGFSRLADVARVLRPTVRDSFELALTELERLATVRPDAWLIDVSSPKSTVTDAVPPLGVRLIGRAQMEAHGVRLLRVRYTP
jgi:type II secretory pathway component PulK